MLSTDSWLVQKAIHEQLAVVIEEPDIARARLRGVPVAHWRHVAAAPIGGDRALLVLASDDRAFSRCPLPRSRRWAEGTPILEQAMLLRHVATALQQFA
ncbi:MAG: hypothetical protein ABIM89_10110 [Mycobacteriales bacterium]